MKINTSFRIRGKERNVFTSFSILIIFRTIVKKKAPEEAFKVEISFFSI